MPTPPNGQTHSNNLSAAADKLLSVFKPFLGSWRLKGYLIFAPLKQSKTWSKVAIVTVENRGALHSFLVGNYFSQKCHHRSMVGS